MPLSTQFRALLKITGFFAGVWAAIGALLGALIGPALTGDTAVSSAATFALLYGTTGAITGATTAFLTARAEAGRHLGAIPTWRLAAWGVLGGIAPPVLFAMLGLIAGAPMSAVLPLWGQAVVGGALGGLVAGSASAAAKRAHLGEPARTPRLPAT